MGQCPLQAEGKSKKQAARELGRCLNYALKMGMHKDGKTVFFEKDGKVIAMTAVHS